MQTFPEPAPGPAGPPAAPVATAHATGAAWVAPEAAVDLPRRSSSASAVGPGSADGAAASSGRALPGSPVARLQPRTVGQLLDAGFEVLRFRFREITTVSLVFAVPLYALPQAVGLLARSAPSIGTDPSVFGVPFLNAAGQTQGDLTTTLIWAYVATVGFWLASMLVGVGMTHQVMGWLTGRDPSTGETIRFVLRRSGVTVLAFVVLLVVKVFLGAVTFGFGLLILIPLLSLAAPVIGAENLGPFASVGRARRLGGRRLGQLIGISALWAVSSGLVGLFAWVAVRVAPELIGSGDAATRIGDALSVLVTLGLLVVRVAVTVLTYIDVRVRTEGLDLMLDAAERLPDVAG